MNGRKVMALANDTEYALGSNKKHHKACKGTVTGHSANPVLFPLAGRGTVTRKIECWDESCVEERIVEPLERSSPATLVSQMNACCSAILSTNASQGGLFDAAEADGRIGIQ